MSVSSSEYWSVITPDGREVALNQYAWSVQSFGGSSRGLPSLRGEEPVYANRPGQAFRPKLAQARTISLEMFVNGLDPDTDTPAYDPELQFNQNWEALQSLFWTPERQIQLVRRWRTSTGVRKATAMAQVAGSMEPEMGGRTRASFSVDLLLSDPYFYGDPITVTVPAEGDALVVNNGSGATTGYGCYLTVKGGVGYSAVQTGFRLWAEYYDSSGNARPDAYPTQYVQWDREGKGVAPGETAVLSIETSVALTNSFVVSMQAYGVPESGVVNTFIANTDNTDFDMLVDGTAVTVTTVGASYSTLSTGTTYYVTNVNRGLGTFSLATASGDTGWPYTSTSSLMVGGVKTTQPYPTTGYVTGYGAKQWLVLYPGMNRLYLTDLDGAALASSAFTSDASVSLTYREPWV